MNKETKRADLIDLILEEEPVSVRLNGSYLLTAMIAPHNKEEFVTGYLFTEELISSLADIESLRIEGSNVSVLTTNPFKISKRRMVLSGCGSSSSFLDEKRLQPILSSSQFQKTIIHKSVCSLPPISAALWNSEGCLFQCSDIGIHSAAVTCIGYGFIHNIDFSSCMLALSGRIATDIVKIALFCKIPLIASSSVPTRLAITIAEKMGLCIICGVNADDMTIYTDKNIAVCS